MNCINDDNTVSARHQNQYNKTLSEVSGRQHITDVHFGIVHRGVHAIVNAAQYPAAVFYLERRSVGKCSRSSGFTFLLLLSEAAGGIFMAPPFPVSWKPFVTASNFHLPPLRAH